MEFSPIPLAHEDFPKNLASGTARAALERIPCTFFLCKEYTMSRAATYNQSTTVIVNALRLWRVALLKFLRRCAMGVEHDKNRCETNAKEYLFC
jgi:hypothetical protein